jgi:hypothetical protein
VDLKFNPGKGVAFLLSALKGLSILTCWTRTSAETEHIREGEHAMVATEGTRQLDELLRLSKGPTHTPAENFWELKVNIVAFMSLVWVLFGSKCDYYKGLRQAYNTFEMKEVGLLKASFTPKYCRWVTWAILNNGQSYFDDVKTTFNFQGPNQIIFPQSYIIDISRNICYATPVECANFPDKWKRRAQPTQETSGGKAPGGNVSQQHTLGNLESPEGYTEEVSSPGRLGQGRTQGSFGVACQGQHGGVTPEFSPGGHPANNIAARGGLTNSIPNLRQ